MLALHAVRAVLDEDSVRRLPSEPDVVRARRRRPGEPEVGVLGGVVVTEEQRRLWSQPENSRSATLRWAGNPTRTVLVALMAL